jgi:hypothetical protein
MAKAIYYYSTFYEPLGEQKIVSQQNEDINCQKEISCHLQNAFAKA